MGWPFWIEQSIEMPAQPHWSGKVVAAIVCKYVFYREQCLWPSLSITDFALWHSNREYRWYEATRAKTNKEWGLALLPIGEERRCSGFSPSTALLTERREKSQEESIMEYRESLKSLVGLSEKLWRAQLVVRSQGNDEKRWVVRMNPSH